MKNEMNRLNHEVNNAKDRIKENNEKIKLNKQLPYLVGNIVEVGERQVLPAQSGHQSLSLEPTMQGSRIPYLS